MEDIVGRALRAERNDGIRSGSTGAGEDREVRVAVVGVGATGADRLTGIGRRLGAVPAPGRVPETVDAFGVDLPGEETTAEGFDPAGWHTVERLERAGLGDEPRLPPDATDRLRGFVRDRVDPYDTVVLAVDGTDGDAVTVASNLAAAFRGGPANPTFAVPTFPAGNAPGKLLAPEVGTGTGHRDRFGPDAVVPVEYGRATELAADTEGERDGSGAPRPLATDRERGAVEHAAEAVTAALAGALALGDRFGCLVDDLHQLRGRVVPHVGRRPAPDDRLEPSALVEDAVRTPLADPPAEWTPGGARLSHLRTPSTRDASVDAVQHRVGETLADPTGFERGDRPAAVESRRVTVGGPNELFLFRFERREDGTTTPDDPVERAASGDHPPVVECGGFPESELDEDTSGTDDESEGGLDVVR